MALVDALETQLAASRATAANLLSALVAELTNSACPRSHASPTILPSGSTQLAKTKKSEGGDTYNRLHGFGHEDWLFQQNG